MFDPADPLTDRPGKGTLFMAEKFAFSRAFGNGGTVDCDEFFVAPVAQIMDGARNQFLAGAGFAGNQDRERYWQFRP